MHNCVERNPISYISKSLKKFPAIFLCATCFASFNSYAAYVEHGHNEHGAQHHELETIDIGSFSYAKKNNLVVDSFTQKDFQKTNASNFIDLIDKNPGIGVQEECSVCSVRSIAINNTPGRFTTVMVDSIPIFSAVSSVYGFEAVPMETVDHVDVSRGAANSSTAVDSLGGNLNIITKKPEKSEVILKGDVGNFSTRNASIYAATKTSKNNAFSFNLGNSSRNPSGSDNSNISNFAGYDRYNAGIGFFADDWRKFKIKARVEYIKETRAGGIVKNGMNQEYIKESQEGNPFDFSGLANGSGNRDGWNKPLDGSFVGYDAGASGLAQLVNTRRVQSTLIGERNTKLGKLRIANGYARHLQNSFYGNPASGGKGDTYNASQEQYYGEVSMKSNIGDNAVLKTGITYRYEDLSSNADAGGVLVKNLDGYKYSTPGGFVEYHRDFLDNKIETDLSVRHDRNNVFGSVTNPRANITWNVNDNIKNAIAVGRGSRFPTSFFEVDHGILSSTKIERHIDKPETSENASYSFYADGERLSFDAHAHYVKIRNMAMIDTNSTDSAGNPITIFSSANQNTVIKGLEAKISYLVTPNNKLSISGERYSYSFQPGAFFFPRPNEKAYFEWEYNKNKFNFFGKAVWTGTQNLAKFGNYENEKRYNFDGSEKKHRSPTFWTFDAQASVTFSKKYNFYVGVKNIFDYVQSKKDSFLWINQDGQVDTTNIWGPTRGRYMYVGLKMNVM